MKLHGPSECLRRCSDCDGHHHMMDAGEDPDDLPDPLTPAQEDALKAGHIEAFFECKHCDLAWAEMDDDDET